MTTPPHHDSHWHELNDGTDTACIYGHEYIEGNYTWAEDGAGRYRVCTYCDHWRKQGIQPPRELPKVAQQAYSFKSNLKQRHSIRITTYNAIINAQGGACAVCKCKPAPDTRLSVDARLGQIVGLLCRRCLTAARMMQNTPSLAISLSAYLQTTSDPTTHDPTTPDAEIIDATKATTAT